MQPSQVDAVFAAFDKNGDGTLSREEFETALAAHRQAQAQAAAEAATVPVYGPPRTAPGVMQSDPAAVPVYQAPAPGVAHRTQMHQMQQTVYTYYGMPMQAPQQAVQAQQQLQQPTQAPKQPMQPIPQLPPQIQQARPYVQGWGLPAAPQPGQPVPPGLTMPGPEPPQHLQHAPNPMPARQTAVTWATSAPAEPIAEPMQQPDAQRQGSGPQGSGPVVPTYGPPPKQPPVFLRADPPSSERTPSPVRVVSGPFEAVKNPMQPVQLQVQRTVTNDALVQSMPSGRTTVAGVMMPTATPTNALGYLLQSQQAQAQRLDMLQSEMSEMKQMLHMAFGKQMNGRSNLTEPKAGSFEAMVPAGSLDTTRQAIPTREEIDQAKRKRMEQARAQTRSMPVKTVFERTPYEQLGHMGQSLHSMHGSVPQSCPACGNIFATDSAFCRKCGRRRTALEGPVGIVRDDLTLTQASDLEREEQLQEVRGQLQSWLPGQHPSGELGQADDAVAAGYDASRLRMPNPHESIEFAVPMDARNDYGADPFLSGVDYSAEGLHGESEGLRSAGNPDPFMSMEFHPQRPDMGASYRAEGVFTPGGTNVNDEPELMGLPGQDPMLAPRTFNAPTSSNTYSSFIKKDWNMDDKYIPVNASDQLKWDSPHHESISGHPIPVLPVTPEEKRGDCSLM